GSARDNGAKAGESHGCLEAGFANRIVQVDARFPAQRSGHVHECSGDGRREEKADVTLIQPIWAKSSGKHNRSNEGLQRGHLRACLVRHGESKRMPSHRTDELTMHRLAVTFSESPGRLAERADRLPQLSR